MAKKKKEETGGGSPPYGTGTVKIAPDLAFKARMVAEFRGRSIAELIDPVLRPFIEAEYGFMVRDAGKIVKEVPQEG